MLEARWRDLEGEGRESLPVISHDLGETQLVYVLNSSLCVAMQYGDRMTLQILVMWTIPPACDSNSGQQITKLSMY